MASLLSGFAPSRVLSAEQGATGSNEPSAAATAEPRSLEAWHERLSRTPVPKKGCFTTDYPSTEWKEIPCTTAPNQPYPPGRRPPPDVVGGGGSNDISAQAPSGSISTAVGSFDSATGVTTESGNVGGKPPAVANSFSLQLNTNVFTNNNNNVPACNGASNPSACQGWQQFIYSNNSTTAFIQYWLLSFNTTCPAGWQSFAYPGPTDTSCFINSAATASVGAQPTAANLGQLRLSGTANAAGDQVVISVGGSAKSTPGDNRVNLAGNWQVAEFNVFGDCCNSEANFDNAPTIVARTMITYGGSAPPNCVAQSFTGETNNCTAARF